MPFINGRYYMNPQYGAALEQAREADEGDDSDAQSEDSPARQFVNAINAPQQQPSRNQKKEPKQFTGDATYYDLPGSKTASGHPFNSNAMSAAMTGEKARLGQHVTVTYSSKSERGRQVSKSISVVVDDRGPFARDQRGKPLHPLKPDPRGVIDLTPAAFKALTGSLKQGRVPVTVTVPDE